MAITASPARDFRAAIMAALGHAPDDIEPGRWHRFATNEKRGNDDGWCRLFDDMRGGVYGCHRQQVSEHWSATNMSRLTPAQRAERALQLQAAKAEREAKERLRWAENAQRNARRWAESVPLLQGDPVTLYLQRRGLGGVRPLPDAVRLHRALPYWDGTAMVGTFPAMLAPLVAPDGRTVALHRTYLTRDGRKCVFR